jgi:glycosyltransferase involved in cell wall biosynthesis
VIGFPASALPRKGIIELALAARQLGWSVLIGGKPDPSPLLWIGVDVQNRSMSDPEWLNLVDLVALPAHVEHAPRTLLAALAKGIPVVASKACGLPIGAGHIEIPAGDMTALIAACRAAMAPCPNNANMVDAG